MTDPQQTDDYGRATIDPAGDVVAGSYGTWRLSYEAGSKGISVGGRIRVYTDSDSDWGTPQFIDPAAAEYMTLEAPEGVRFDLQTTGVKSLLLSIDGRELRPGERVTFIYGDRSGGGPGSRAQTFLEQKRYFWADVNIDKDDNSNSNDDSRWVTLSEPPDLTVVADEAVRLVVVAPSTVMVGDSFRVLVKAEDKWGNPSASYRGTVAFEGDGVESERRLVAFDAKDAGTQWVEGFRTPKVGALKILAADRDNQLQTASNPIISTQHVEKHLLCWADPHGGQLVMNSKIAEFFRYARDVAGVQFVGYQRNADVISTEDWPVTQQQERAFHEPGRFVPIPGFEWSGRTGQGGHHNVYFRRHDQPVRRNAPTEEMFQSPREQADLLHIHDVYDAYRNTDAIITPHGGGEHSDLTPHDPTLEPAVEITSSHGTFEWMLRDALRRGYKLGFLGGSDSYTGRPGDDRPGYQLRRYAKAGLTGIYAEDVSLEGFFEAMRARRVYATTGARIVLHVNVDGHLMGSEYCTSDWPTLAVAVAGTAPLESVELFRGLELVYTHPPQLETASNRIRILFSGSSRMTSYSGVIWDGSLTVNGGKIAAVETLRFDSPRSQVVDRSENDLRWHAWGCGYPMGLLVDLQGGSDLQLQVVLSSQTITGPGYGGHGEEGPRRISFAEAERTVLRMSLKDLEAGPQEYELGVIDRKLSVSLAPQSGPTTANFQVLDDSPQPGINSYWVRVVQTDMEMAWTSPVFVDFAPP